MKCQRRRAPCLPKKIELKYSSIELKRLCQVISGRFMSNKHLRSQFKMFIRRNTSQWNLTIRFVLRFNARQGAHSTDTIICKCSLSQNVYAKATSCSYLRAPFQGGCYGRKEGFQCSKTSRARKYSKLARYQNDAITPIERIGSFTIRLETLLLVSAIPLNSSYLGKSTDAYLEQK